MRPVCDHGITHICLDVADIDAEYERLKSAGMMFRCPPQGMGGLRATDGRDPDGNVVELLELTDASSPMALKAGSIQTLVDPLALRAGRWEARIVELALS